MVYEDNTTIEWKRNYKEANKIKEEDLNKLFQIIETSLKYTKDILLFGCSFFRNITKNELEELNNTLNQKYNLELNVVSQEEEANYTALGCYHDIGYDKTICIFIGGGGSTELIFVKQNKIIDKKYYDFGVVDITQKFSSLKDDKPTCTFQEVYDYISGIMKESLKQADILILAGGDHLYWYNNANYELLENTLYQSEKQKYMLTTEMSDQYDQDAMITSLDRIRNNSDNPLWFDGSRAMKVITNLISHKINAKYIIPTKINMEDGIRISKQKKEK